MTVPTLHQADRYHGAGLFAGDWLTHDKATRQAALVEAARQIDALPVLRPPPPEVARVAVFEQARALLDRDIQKGNRRRKSGVASVHIGDASESYHGSDPDNVVRGIWYAPAALSKLTPYLRPRVVAGELRR